MSLHEMKDDLHDALWNAQQEWFALREEGETKHGLKMAGLRDAGDPNRYTRDVLFTGRTRATYERDLREFVKFCHERFGVQHLRDITDKHARTFLEKAIDEHWAAKTLHKLRSELAKLGALIGKTASFVALSAKYGGIIRGLQAAEVVVGPTRKTPSADVVARTIEILRERDARYYLAARLQSETAGRNISTTDRVTRESLRDGNIVELVGKGGKVQIVVISAELHAALRAHLTAHPGPLADRDAYRAALARAIAEAGGRVSGSHGLRRRSTRDYYRERYRERRQRGETSQQARAGARQDAVERLGHGRDRIDQANAYLGPAA